MTGRDRGPVLLQPKAANPPPASAPAGLPQPLAALYVDQRAVENVKRSLDNLVIATEKSALSTEHKAKEMHDLTQELAGSRTQMERDRVRRGPDHDT